MDNKTSEYIVDTDVQVDLENGKEDNNVLDKDVARTKKAKSVQTSQGRFKEKVCEVISYNKKASYVDVKFDKYGIRLQTDREITNDKVTVKYQGEIGKPNFRVELKV